MHKNKKNKMSGRDHYSLLYKAELASEAEWLRRCAIEKVNSIEYLLSRNNIKPVSLLELGCGTGAVILECQKRQLAEDYFAMDYSEEAIHFIRENSSGIKTFVDDITAADFSGRGFCFDVIVLSHVLEHLEDPRVFLQHLRQIPFSYLIAEVPLEDLFFGKIKAKFRKTRGNDKAGHVQFFSADSFRKLFFSCDYSILDERRYVPVVSHETIKYVCKKDSLGTLQYLKMMLTWNLLPKLFKPFWSLLYNANYAILCRHASYDK